MDYVNGMTQTLEEKTKQEISKLSRYELILNFARHLPLLYIPASVIAKPILVYSQNPVDYYIEQGPVGIAIASTGLALAAAGTLLKTINDENEMQSICANIREENNQQMVETGIYNHTRHPCYFAQTLIATGFFMISPAIDTGMAFASYLGLTQKCAKTEERKNLAQFGDMYSQYMDKVQRWPKLLKIPKLFSSVIDYFSETKKSDISADA